jgi:hypothetical protein
LVTLGTDKIPASADRKENQRRIAEALKEPLSYDGITDIGFGPGQITIEHFAYLLGKDVNLRKAAKLDSIDLKSLYANSDPQINMVKQLAVINKLIDPEIGSAVIVASTKEYLDKCKGDFDCESAIHAAGPGKAKYGLEFQAKVAYLRKQVRGI